MSKIHTALQESAVIAHGVAASGEASLSPLDQALIAAGIPREVLAEAHTQKGNNGGFFEGLLRKKAIGETPLLKILALHFGLDFRPDLPVESINIDFTQSVSIQYLKKHKMVPLITGQDAVIAVNDPANFQPVDS
jgi:general secretion pathway protein E